MRNIAVGNVRCKEARERTSVPGIDAPSEIEPLIHAISPFIRLDLYRPSCTFSLKPFVRAKNSLPMSMFLMFANVVPFLNRGFSPGDLAGLSSLNPNARSSSFDPISMVPSDTIVISLSRMNDVLASSQRARLKPSMLGRCVPRPLRSSDDERPEKYQQVLLGLAIKPGCN